MPYPIYFYLCGGTYEKSFPEDADVKALGDSRIPPEQY
jgi:hypothetical protein